MGWTANWSPAERRLIAKGEAAADEPGVIPAEFVGPERAAWRAGYGRGWAGLCTVSRVDPPEHLPVKAAWSAGWTAGSAACKKAGVGFDPFVLASGREYGDRATWSQDECDAFDVGYKLGRETENEHKALLFRPRIYWGLLGHLFHFFDRGRFRGLDARRKALAALDTSGTSPDGASPTVAAPPVPGIKTARHPVTRKMAPRPSVKKSGPPSAGRKNAWTKTESRAIALGEKAADELAVIPQDLTGGSKAAWRAGFARGWAGLIKGGHVDMPKLVPFKDAWREGHRKGMEVCKAAADGFKITWDPGVATTVTRGRATWSQEQADAYDEGYQAGSQGFTSAMMALRYRGPLQGYVTMWLWGQVHGRKGFEPDGSGRLKATVAPIEAGRRDRRHPVTSDQPVASAEPTKAAADKLRKAGLTGRHPVTPERSVPGSSPRTTLVEKVAKTQLRKKRHRRTESAEAASLPARKAPATGAERQRAYRARRRSRSIDVSWETHTLLRQLQALRGVRVDQALQLALRAALGEATKKPSARDRGAGAGSRLSGGKADQ